MPQIYVALYVYMSRDACARVLCFLAVTAWLFLPSSRQTQWDPPTWESPGDDASLEHEAEMDLGTPTYDENPMKVSVAYTCFLIILESVSCHSAGPVVVWSCDSALFWRISTCNKCWRGLGHPNSTEVWYIEEKKKKNAHFLFSCSPIVLLSSVEINTVN